MASDSEIRDLIEKMTEERARFIERVRPLSDVQASRRPEGQTGEAEWSPKEQLAHLWQMERNYVAWVRHALAEDGADLTGVQGEPPAISLPQANDHPMAALLDALATERAGTLAFIRSLAPADFDRRASQPLFGQLTILQWLRSFYRHDRMHTAQIAGEQSTYRPRYASGVEPDQRQRPAP